MEIKSGWGREALPVELVKRGCREGVEIGVCRGEYSEKLLNAGIERLWLVDLWRQQEHYFDIANVTNVYHSENMRETLTRMGGFPFRTHVLCGLSHEVSRLVPDASVDFIYIDGAHNLEAVRVDLAAWYPKVRAGGIVSGHDFLDSGNCCGSEFGVKTAVTEFCEANGIGELFVCQDEPFPNWAFFKP